MFRELTGAVGLSLEQGAAGASEAGPFIELLITTRAELRKGRSDTGVPPMRISQP